MMLPREREASEKSKALSRYFILIAIAADSDNYLAHGQPL